jgi:hypothetical protein
LKTRALIEKDNLTRSFFWEKSLSIVKPHAGLCWSYGLLDMQDFPERKGPACSLDEDSNEKIICFPNLKSQWFPTRKLFVSPTSSHCGSPLLWVHGQWGLCKVGQWPPSFGSVTSTQVLAFSQALLLLP